MPEYKSEFARVREGVMRDFPRLFAALEEYDTTHTMRKLSYKTRANFTIDSNIFERFKRHCQANGKNMSKILEKHIKEELAT